MKISVVIATYNGEKYIEEQLESIITQSHKVDEIIVSDDGSTDCTIKIINSFLSRFEIKYQILVNSQNLGVAKNFEQAIKNCDGDIIFFSDQDDIWLPNKVKEHLDIYERHDNVNLVFSDAILFEGDKIEKDTVFNRFNFKRREALFKKDQMLCLLKGWFVTGATMSARKSFVKGCLPFSRVMLHDQWLSAIAADSNSIYMIKEPLIKYRQHTAQVVGAKKIDNLKAYKINFCSDKEIAEQRALLERIPNHKNLILSKIEYIKTRENIRSYNLPHRAMMSLKYLISGGYRKFSIKPFYSFLKDTIKGNR